ncbi:MAG: hypothetical protein JNL33_02390 [Betaproteobacteria bacterium]|nr:hypothetical protein [Betaproteobacteria bacterium]
MLLAAVMAVSGAPVSAADDDVQQRDRVRAEVDALVAANRRCHNVVHCHLLSMGFDACGNPTYHVAFNNVTSVKTQLEAKAAEYTFLEEEMRRGKPAPASCPAPGLPKAACHRNQCAVGALND